MCHWDTLKSSYTDRNKEYYCRFGSSYPMDQNKSYMTNGNLSKSFINRMFFAMHLPEHILEEVSGKVPVGQMPKQVESNK